MPASPSAYGPFSLAGQVAVVTGAGKGIGRACALMLAQAGADIALCARTQADLDAVAQEIRAMGQHQGAGPAYAFACPGNDRDLTGQRKRPVGNGRSGHTKNLYGPGA